MVKNITNVLTWLISGGLLLASVGFVAVATPLVGNRALIVRSGSMEPTISVGDLVVVRPRNEAYKTGDVVAHYMPGRDGVIVTHRIIEVNETGEGAVYRTQGDANNEVDEYTLTNTDMIGRQLFVMPYIGKLFALAKTRAGFFAFVVLPALIVIASEARVIMRELRRAKKKIFEKVIVIPVLAQDYFKPRSAPLQPRMFVDSISRPLILFMASLLIFTQSSWALLTDSGTSSNNVFAAAATFGTPTPTPPTPTPTVTPTSTPTPTPEVANHVVISEVRIAGSNASEDFIELYNPTSSPIDIGGWELRKKNDNGNPPSGDLIRVIDTGTTISAHGYFLWANFATVPAPDQSDGAKNLTTGDSIVLLNAQDSTVDQVAWGAGATDRYIEGSAFPSNPSAGQSIERKAFSTSTTATMAVSGTDELKGNGFDSDNNSTDFVLRTASQPQNLSSSTESP